MHSVFLCFGKKRKEASLKKYRCLDSNSGCMEHGGPTNIGLWHAFNCVSLSSIKKDILQLDFSLLLTDAASHPSQIFVEKIASSQVGSWPKLWDLALERGVLVTTCIQAVSRLLSTQTIHALSRTVTSH